MMNILQYEEDEDDEITDEEWNHHQEIIAMYRQRSLNPSTNTNSEDIYDETDDIINEFLDSLHLEEEDNSSEKSEPLSTIGLYRYRRIEDFHLPDNTYEIIPLISPQTGRQLQNQQGRYVHMGLITIGVRSHKYFLHTSINNFIKKNNN